MPAKQCIVGLVFGKLTVISEAQTRRSPKGRPIRFSLCQCSCGSPPKEIRNECLTSGTTKSCGCLIAHTNLKNHKTHGMTKTSIYYSWHAMVYRCRSEKSASWCRYGKIGITVCERWLTFENFLEDMGPKPSGTEIERRDNNLGYHKDNCYWGTQHQQDRNKCTNRNFTILGHSGCMSDLCKIFNIKFNTVSQRLERNWDPVSAFTSPLHQRRPRPSVG